MMGFCDYERSSSARLRCEASVLTPAPTTGHQFALGVSEHHFSDFRTVGFTGPKVRESFTTGREPDFRWCREAIDVEYP
jgi:hypothetical protein